MSDFLFELGTEELPVAAGQELSEALAECFQAALLAANITHGQVRCFGTPRRIGILVHDVAATQSSQLKTRRGPAVAGSRDAQERPNPALLGFAKSCGVAVEDLQIQTTEKGSWWFYSERTEAVATPTLLPTILQQILTELPVRKAMRWGVGDVSFSRPVHWAVMLWGQEVLEADILDLVSGRCSYGHRFHHPGAITITAPSAYPEQLLAANVVADFKQRAALIREQITQLAAAQALEVVIPDALLREVTSIVEWPRALLADFDPQFLTIPAEALIEAMQVHQKCFALYSKRGKIAPHFIAVSNIDSQDMHQVKMGNEKVMRARLSDAAFFYQQDKRHGLAAHIPALQHVIFQTQLGSVADKSARLAKIMARLQTELGLDPKELARAAVLSKCDLLTGMVSEFPDLQGVMGYYYAMHDYEPAAVAVALKEQYLPRFALDDLPTSPLGCALSLADRLDTLYGLFAIGNKPSGVKDPFKLRRHALAIARILLHLPGDLSLRMCFQAAADAYVGHLEMKPLALIDELQAFVLDRLQSYYQNQAVPVELFQAVRVCQEDCLFDMAQRMTALIAFIQLPQAQALTAMAKRVNNVLAQATITVALHQVQPSLCHIAAEQTLLSEIEQAEQRFLVHTELEYSEKLGMLVAMQPSLAAFFDQVLVMDPDQNLQNNRLAILARLRILFSSIADISHLASITK